MDIVKIGKAAPVEDIVEQLKKMLGAAERGEIRHIIAMVSLSDGSTVNLNKGEANDLITLGYVMRMAHRLNKDMDESVKDYNFDVPMETE